MLLQLLLLITAHPNIASCYLLCGVLILHSVIFHCYVRLQFSAVLQSEEHIPEDLHDPAKQSLEVSYSSFTSVQENCLHTKKTHLVLPIPFTACPEFVSDLGKPDLKEL